MRKGFVIAIVISIIGLISLAIFAYIKFGGVKDKPGGRLVDIISSKDNLYILSEGQRECGFPCIDTPADYIKPILWEISVSERKITPHIITERFENVSNYGNSCDRLVDLGESLFLHCPKSYLFSKSTKVFREIDSQIGNSFSHYSSMPSVPLMAVLKEKNVSFYGSDLNLLKSLDTDQELKSLVFKDEGFFVFYPKGVISLDEAFNKNADKLVPIQSRSGSVFLDSNDTNVAYYYSSSSSNFLEDQVFIMDFKTELREGPISFLEARQDKNTVHSYRVGSFAQTSDKIYFLLKTYISEPGVGKDGPVELVIVDKPNFDITKRVKLKLNKNDSLSDEWLSTNVNMLAINGQNLYISINKRINKAKY